MKRYIFGIAAVIIALGAVAFTKPKKPVDMYVFQFDGTQAYTVSNVQNISNTYWKYQGKNLDLCTDINQKACRVEVTSSYVNDPSNPTALNGVTINAALYSPSNTAYVTSISGTSSQYSNQSH
jgi:hypothetical protein